MKQYPITTYLPQASSIVYGCMGLGGGWNKAAIDAGDIRQANQVIDAALDNGINYFDHADIYSLGKAEQVFGEALKQRNDRNCMYIQTKCGIRFEDDAGPKRYDLSKAWIINQVEQSLRQLQLEYLDVLVLHRPDPLMEPSEIADTFNSLQRAGKVGHLGVSNMQQYQIGALQQELNSPLVVNQIEMSLKQHDWLDEGIYAGHRAGAGVNFTSGLLDYCQRQNMQIQSWGSLCQGLYSGAELSQASAADFNTAKLVSRLALRYDTSAEAILLAWLMKHPAAIQPVIGTTNVNRISACVQAKQLQLSKEDWYALYVCAKGAELP